jgi:lipoyl(octanoyl) transferase
MRTFTDERDAQTADEFWLLEHPSVFTLGQAGRREHVLGAGNIPVLHSDRGGQVTYHGPGQVVLYALVDLRRLRIGVRTMVNALERAVIDLLAEQDVHALRRDRAPGVYVRDAKVAALGLRVRNARTYHGVALNVDMDLAPFSRIDPCGFRGLAVTQLRDLGVALNVEQAGTGLARHLSRALGLSLARVEHHAAAT